MIMIGLHLYLRWKPKLWYKSYSGGRWTWSTPLKSPESKSKSPSPTRRSRVGLGDLNLDEAYLSWSCTRRKASTPRRSRGVLASLRVNIAEESVVKAPSPSPQVQLGFAALDLGTCTWTQGTWAESAKSTSPRCRTYTIILLLTWVDHIPIGFMFLCNILRISILKRLKWCVIRISEGPK